MSVILPSNLLCDNSGVDCGWTDCVFAVMDNWIGITACLEELEHFLCFLREVSVVATKTSQSKELRVRDGILDVCWVGSSVVNSCVSLWVCSARSLRV